MTIFSSEPGTRLGGRYRLEDRTAAAAGWVAWKAVDETLARPVSVLTFEPGFPRVREVVTAARAASRLTDPRLARVFDVEDDQENAYVVMEWPAGDSLQDLLAGGSLDPSNGARMVAEAAGALSAAHAAGLAHLCLTPESLRVAPGGAVKVLGLGTDAALAGIVSDDPALADTRGLGRLLYAALTGMWPDSDGSALPPAPRADGLPCSPRQVTAGVPHVLDDLACRALMLRARSGPPLTTPAELGAALAAATPPEPVPKAQQVRVTRSRSNGGPAAATDPRSYQYWPDGTEPAPGYPLAGNTSPVAKPGGRARRTILILLVVLVLAAVAGAMYSIRSHHGTARRSRHHPVSAVTHPASQVLTPVSAAGFDETSTNAHLAIDGNPSTAWQTQYYIGNPVFGGLKAGSGLILDMGKPVRVQSVQVTFGPVAGANVQIKLGTSNQQGTTAADSMPTIASANDVSGTRTFTATGKVTGRYLLIWFTKLPPKRGTPNQYQAEIFNVVVRGTRSAG
jgi:hypothetical protein